MLKHIPLNLKLNCFYIAMLSIPFWVSCNKIHSTDNDSDNNGLSFLFDDLNRTAMVTYNDSIPNPNGNPSWPFAPSPTYSGAIVVPSSIKKDGIEYIVTAIGRGAFYKSRISSISIPSTVTDIDICAFSYCEDLTNATIPEGVESIKASAFYRCRNLASLVLPRSVKHIGDDAFADCTSLMSLAVPDELEIIDGSPYEAFYMVPNLEYHGSLILGSIRKTLNGFIDNGFVFKDQEKTTLTACPSSMKGEISIPKGVMEIGSSAFSDCDLIVRVVIPDGVTGISSWAFSPCKNLKTVNFPNSITAIGQFAFNGCPELVNPIYNDNLFARLPQSYSGTFEVPMGIKTICYDAFNGCKELQSVILPESITEVKLFAFDNCNKLSSIICKATNPPKYDPLTNRDIDISAITLYVPENSVDAYSKATGWKDFPIIKAIE